MHKFKAILIDWGPMDDPPAWMAERLAVSGIEYTVTRSITQEALLRNAAQANAIVSGGHRRLMTAENMDALPNLVALVKLGSGVDNVDVDAATERGVIVANTPDAVTETVSDHAIALLLAAVRKIPQQNRLIRAGVWSIKRAAPGRHLRGATLGLVGFGRIGRDVARKLVGFEMNLLVYDPYLEDNAIEEAGAKPVPLEELLSRSDFVSVHCPLTELTERLIGEREFRLMRPEAILVNTSRGPVVDEAALNQALREGWIAGAALDVLEKEPPDSDNPLLELDNVIITPHMSSMSDLFPGEIWIGVYQTLVDLANHRWPASVVNPDVKPRWPLG